MKMVSLKAWHRNLYSRHEEKRQKVEEAREIVDKRHLQLENLLYKQDHLQREIIICKDILTPELQKIEEELGKKFTVEKYTSDLEQIHNRTIDSLLEELAMRKEVLAELEEKTREVKELEDTLERKRKFVEELPSKVLSLEAAAKDLHTQLSSEKDTIESTILKSFVHTQDLRKYAKELSLPLYTLFRFFSKLDHSV